MANNSDQFKKKRHFDASSFMKSASRKTLASGDSVDSTNKLNEALYYINLIKNSATVTTGEHEALTSLFTGQKIYVDTRDISVAPHLMLDGTWEPEITKVFRSLLNPESIVVDLGANFGYFGIIAGSTVKEGRILFIEANKELIGYITKSASVNGLTDISTISNLGIGDKEATMNLTLVGDYLGSSTFSEKGKDIIAKKFHAEPTATQKVRLTTLDKYCAENKVDHIDILKVDIEGFEEVAYTGMSNIIKSSPDLKLLLEFTAEDYDKPKDFFKKIANDFKYMYVIKSEPLLTQISSYQEFDELAAGDWAMILASKNEIELNI